MGIFDFFKSSGPSPKDRENPSIRKIVRALEALPLEEARYIAAFAFILGRVAHADLEISAEETKAMEEIVEGFGGVSRDMAILITQIAKSQNILFGGTENYLVTREFKSMSDFSKREGLLHALFAVAGADENITHVENEEIRQIAKELGLSPQEFTQVRLHYREKLAVLK